MIKLSALHLLKKVSTTLKRRVEAHERVAGESLCEIMSRQHVSASFRVDARELNALRHKLRMQRHRAFAGAD
jgi:hypothetical protein